MKGEWKKIYLELRHTLIKRMIYSFLNYHKNSWYTPYFFSIYIILFILREILIWHKRKIYLPHMMIELSFVICKIRYLLFLIFCKRNMIFLSFNILCFSCRLCLNRRFCLKQEKNKGVKWFLEYELHYFLGVILRHVKHYQQFFFCCFYY